MDNCLSQCDASDSGGTSGSGGSGAGKEGSGTSAGNGGGGTVDAACYIAAQSSCTATPVPRSEKSTLDDQCTQGGGVASDSCPDAGLIGCCTFGAGPSASTKVCSYMAGSGFDEASCSDASGTWSTTP